MIRMVLYLVGVALAATGLAWLADRPGSLIVNWEGYEVETSVFRAVVMAALMAGLAIFLWSLLSQISSSPAMLGTYFTRRRQERGLDALSSGMIAIGAGDRTLALQAAVQAKKALPNEPLTHLLRAQAAQLAGDRSTSRRIFEAMLGSPDTEQLGLRGLFLEAEREGEAEAARQFAERAMRLNPKLGWAIEALFERQCRNGDWAEALEILAAARKHGHFEKAVADRRRAVLLTAQAQAIEEANGNKAQALALEAHGLAPDLIPAAVIAGRQLAAHGATPRAATPRAAKVIERTWKLAPHPDLALIYAYARPGDSPRDRLDRIKRLARFAANSPEGPIAYATAAVEAREWDEARAALAPIVEGGLSHRVCTLMARIEGEQHNDAGRVREWLARASGAPRDPAWVADGVVSERWAAISPVSGQLDVYQWRVPAETQNGGSEAERALRNIEELVLLGTRPAKNEAAGLGGTTTATTADPETLSEPPGRIEPRRPEIRRHPASDGDRPITVEVRPVVTPKPTTDATPAAALTTPSTASSGVPLHPQKRLSDEARANGTVGASTDAAAGRTIEGVTATRPAKP